MDDRLAVEMGLLKCQGKTPEATMASALYTDVKRKLHKSLFTRPQEGLFGLREWLEERYYPEGWVGPPDGLGLAPFKRRNNTGAHQGGPSAAASASKAGRQGVRTGPGRSSKSRASRSWRSASSDAEDDDMLEDDDDDMVMAGGRAYPGGSAAAHAGGSAAGMAGHGEDEDVDEAMGEGEDVDMDEEGDGGDDGAADEGQEEQGSDRRVGYEELGGGGAGLDEQRHVKDVGSARGHPQPAASPGPGTGRRGGRLRSGGGFPEPGPPQDECLSPLHMLGEAAASESMGELVAEQLTHPPAKRKRPSSITVPDRGGGLGGVEGITPKSPYEDSLAALHEIATSPSTFELTSHRESHQKDRDGGRGALAAGDGAGTGGGKGETTPAILLQASPVTTANGQQAMVLRQAPVLVTLPPALASPSAAAVGQLDTAALLHVQLPGGAPSELMQTTIITPTGQQLTPLRPHTGGTGQSGRGNLKVDTGPASSRPVGRRVSFSGQVSGPGGAVNAAGTVPAGNTPGGQTWPPCLTPAQVEHELTEITRVQKVVERLESKLGNTHPQVGKAWLSVARMYQHLAEAQRNNGESCASSKAKSVEALKRARAVCQAVAESCGTTLQCEAAFDYLTARNELVGDADLAVEAGPSPVDGTRPTGGSVSPPAVLDGVQGQGAALVLQAKTVDFFPVTPELALLLD
ncbi:hypothetical protein VOLCADRAFT_115965 [Volvox carteri f. nagariensis]|uniref:HTH HARE-type domain-containing protein n=1 Tax=Volvox carteri f. nagariensis TaxID=3068 RepID=D8TJ73_VOLCA|nr:uncharacterized protein VOLCADRAFT_115965 [Volvox carteri f. nagariensis]EFJ52489.1 hypothetical protein VOLCADRAFT_115965 [Volvox carteri f. nagariensis]|eukprot:XP_002946562.1 hypothetical protein VOLCADRAFT_115965 [Volvox carteri f. nagariensis]